MMKIFKQNESFNFFHLFENHPKKRYLKYKVIVLWLRRCEMYYAFEDGEGSVEITQVCDDVYYAFEDGEGSVELTEVCEDVYYAFEDVEGSVELTEVCEDVYYAFDVRRRRRKCGTN